MSLLQSYLQNSRTQRVLKRKPGEEGFSLIELVVVIAVLAVLIVIALLPRASRMTQLLLLARSGWLMAYRMHRGPNAGKQNKITAPFINGGKFNKHCYYLPRNGRLEV